MNSTNAAPEGGGGGSSSATEAGCVGSTAAQEQTPPQATAAPTTVDAKKTFIRKIIAIDVEKLRQVGLDRKIAEAMNRRQKLATAAAATATATTSPTSTTTTTTTTEVAPEPPILPAVILRKIVPPKITITRPLESPPTTCTTYMSPTEDSKFNMPLSTDSERLAHAKSVLKKNLVMKAEQRRNMETMTTPPPQITSTTTITTTSTETTSSNSMKSTTDTIVSTSCSASISSCPTNEESLLKNVKSCATFVDRPKKVQRTLKPPPRVLAAAKKPSPLKTPQEIARVLDFSGSSDADSHHNISKEPPLVLNYTLPIRHNQLPYAPAPASSSTHTFQESFKKQTVASVETKPTHSDAFMNFVKVAQRASTLPNNYQHLPQAKNIQSSPEQIDDIPKASIKASTKRMYAPPPPPQPENPFSSSSMSSFSGGKMPLGFPEVSPLKQPFPSISLPGETPLPTISTFKKPFAAAVQAPVPVKLELSSESFGQPTYFTLPYVNDTSQFLNFMKQTSNPSYITSSTKSLIVLENKVLSQDEKIDLAALRLANPTPPLATPPSPSLISSSLHPGTAGEIVIKQEKDIDEFLPESMSTIQLKPNPIALRSSLLTQPRKFIQAADKLKLPPEKIAALARQIQSQAMGKLKKQSGTILRIPTKTNLKEKLARGRLLTDTKSNKSSTRVTNITSTENSVKKESDKVEKYENSFNQMLTPFDTTLTSAVINQLKPSTKPPQMLKDNYIDPTFTVDFKNEYLHETKPIVSPQNTTSELCGTRIKTMQSSDLSASICKVEKLDKKPKTDQYDYKPHQFSYASSTSSAVEIMKEPLNQNAPTISAVDFIASLISSHPITEETTLELSPEELNLNASFAMNLSPIRIPYYTRKEYQASEKSNIAELPPNTNTEFLATEDMFLPNDDDFGVKIGKIVTIQKDNNVSQLSRNAEGIFTLPAIGRVKNEIDINVEPILNNSLSKDKSSIGNITTIRKHNSVENEIDIIHKPILNESLHREVASTSTIHVEPIQIVTLQSEENTNLLNENNDALIEHRSECMPYDINPCIHNEVTANEVCNTAETTAISQEIVVRSTEAEIIAKTTNPELDRNENLATKEIIEHNEMENKLSTISVVMENKIISQDSTSLISRKTRSQSLERKEMEESNPETGHTETNEIFVGVQTQEIITNITEENDLNKQIEIISPEDTILVVQECTGQNMAFESKETKTDIILSQTSPDVSTSNTTDTTDTTVTAISKKRISRFKKGTINLIQRKKSTASNVQSKTEISKEEVKIQSNTLKHITINVKDNSTTSEIYNEESQIQPNTVEHVRIHAKDSIDIGDSNVHDSNIESTQTKTELQNSMPKFEDISNKPSESAELIQKDTQIAPREKIAADISSQKDISQLINPPPMPKKKKLFKDELAVKEKTIPEAESTNSNSVSLLEAVNDVKEPELLPPAQIPFRRKSLELEARYSEEPPLGIKSLLKQLDNRKATELDGENKGKNKFAADEEVNTLNNACDENKTLQTLVFDKLKPKEINDSIATSEQPKNVELTKLADNKPEEDQALSNSLLYSDVESEVAKNITNCKIYEKESDETQGSISESTEVDFHPKPDPTDLNSDHKMVADSLKVSDKFSPTNRRSTRSSLLQEENQQQNTNVVEKISTNDLLLNSRVALKSPHKQLVGSAKYKLLPVTPSEKNDTTAEIKKHNYPSQSSEDAEIYSSHYDDDDEIAATAEESSQELVTMKTIQRKRLRKTVLDKIKNRKRPFDTDSDDERDDGVVNVECDATSDGVVTEFLGFDETSPTNSKLQKSIDLIIAATSAESGDEAETGGQNRRSEITTSSSNAAETTSVDNWLTTEKTIAPTSFYSSKTIRHKVATIGTRSSTNMPLKKRWEAQAKHRQHDETDVTDDTSPADDDNDDDQDEEEKFQKLLRANSVNIIGKRSLQILGDVEAEIIASKKLKLTEERKEPETNCRLNLSESDSGNQVASFLKPKPPPTLPDAEVSVKNTDDVVAACVAKKRGRKPKATKVVEALETNESVLHTHRERTPKRFFDEKIATSTTPKKDTSPMPSEQFDEVEALTTTSTPNIPKTRGRKAKIEYVKEAAETISDENTPEVQKKRGRPSKAIASTTINKTTTVVEQKSIIEYFETIKTTQESQSAEVRAPEIEQTDNTQPVYELFSSELDTTTNVPKKRGRKPKKVCLEDVDPTTSTTSPVAPHQPDIDLSADVLLSDDDTPLNKLRFKETETTPSLPKTRGRKAKIKETSTIAPADSTQIKTVQKENTPPVKKRRGRKPKVAAASTSMADEDNQTTTNDTTKQNSIIEYFEAHDAANATITTPTLSDSVPKELTMFTEESPVDMTRKRGRKSKSLTIAARTSSTESQCDAAPALAAGNVLESSDFNPRLLLIRNRTEINSAKVLTVTAGVGVVQCGLCLMRTTHAKWTQHLADHYGVGWIVGKTKQNLCLRSSVLNIIINYYKNTKIKGLACRMCGRMYRSGLGMLMHIETCGIPRTRQRCELCNREYQYTSLETHQRTCALRIKKENAAETIDMAVPNILNNVGRVKRASLMKAESKLKAIGEELVNAAAAESNKFEPKNHIKYHAPLVLDEIRNEWKKSLESLGKAFCPLKVCRFYLEGSFSSDILTEMEKHLETCKHKPKSGYHCIPCRTKIFELEANAIKHVLQKHNPQAGSDFEPDSSDCDIKMLEDDDDEDDDDEEEGVSSGQEEAESLNDDDEPEASTSAGKRRRQGAEKTPSKKKKRKIRRAPAIQSLCKPLYPRRSDNCTRLAGKKWNEFSTKNRTTEVLYTYAMPTFTVRAVDLDAGHRVNDSDANDVVALEKCLPSQHVSMKYALKKSQFNKDLGAPDTSIDWSELKRFETAQIQNDQFVFLGAPVKALAWAPLPPHVQEQYLLMAYRKDIDKYTRLLNPNITPALILVYKVTMPSPQQEDDKPLSAPQAQLLYAVRIPEGPVQCFDFLPSGGYDEANNRLGLLAVGTSVGATVNIYPLPLKSQQPETDEANAKACNQERLNVIELKPAMALTHDMESMHLNATKPTHAFTAPHCLQICWSETLPHSHVFASYSNGCIGIWDTSAADDANSNLNCFIVESLRIFAPLNYFYVGEKIIRALSVHYDTTGPRWVAAACHSRKFIVYDIRDMTQPLVVKEEHSKNVVRCLDWSALWENPVLGFCDIVPKDGRAAITLSLLGVIFNRNKIDNMLCSVTQIHYNPALNVHACATDNGDIVFLNTRELHREDIFSRSQENTRAIATMDIKSLDGAPLSQVENKNGAEGSDDYKQRYGLIFGTVIKYKNEHKSQYLSAKRIPPSNLTPYMRINALRCNLNVPTLRLVAVGYENGFLRITRINKDAFLKG